MIGADHVPTRRFPHPDLPHEAYQRTTLVLRVGLLLAVSFMVGALAAYLLANPGASSASAIASNPILPYLSLGGFVHGLAAGSPTAYLTLGLFLLIATPITRVMVGVHYFHRGHEREMTLVTLTVLVLLLLGIFVFGPLIR